MNLTPNYRVNDLCLDFIVTKVLPIEELNVILYELRHEKTGAEVMHIASDDPENLFCLSFRTLPSDSTGVAHILEHTVLCGSKKFPIKDPFFSMNRRSLNTFMNAMTGSDVTFYPAASQVEADFYNLLEVYLDAVFFPKLKELSFLQEGHRLEFERPGDLTSPLIFKGIVFNEMKGNLAHPENRLWQALLESLTPDLTYAFNSGGDPKCIPELTYEGLKEFHTTYYHPSRCLFFFYGNLPLENHLKFIDKHVLKSASALPPIPPIPMQKRFHQAVDKTIHYPLQEQDLERKTFLAYGWLTARISDQDDALALAALDSILMETDASPLKHALLESKLCTQVDSYLDLDMSEIPYAIVCKGCNEKSKEELKALIIETLKKMKDERISPSLVEAALHQLAFNRLEITRDHGPFGLTLFGRAAFAKQHGASPENALLVHAALSALEERARDPRYFSNLIETYLLDNPHFVSLTCAPDVELAEKEEREEKETLARIQATLSASDQEKMLTQAKLLKEYQTKSENQSLACLPCIQLEDIPKDPPHFPLNKQRVDQLKVFHHSCFTNHIVYADLLFDLPHLTEEDLPYLQLLTTLIPELGLGKRNYCATLEYINAHLGDFGASFHLHPQAANGNTLRPSFSLKGRALSRSTDKLFDLFKDGCSNIDLNDTDRITKLILQIHTMQQNKLNRHALSYAVQLSLSGMTQPGAIGEKCGGLSYFAFIRDLATNLSKRLPTAIDHLKRLSAHLFHGHTPHLILSCSDADYEKIQKAHFYGLNQLSTSPYTPWESLALPLVKPPSQGRPIASPVAFSALGLKVEPGFHPHSPALSLATYLLENTILHAKIREQGGAYGSGASYSPSTGHFYFYGYRDPHIAATYDTFKSSIEALARGAFNEKDLMEAKLGLIQDTDGPVAPENRAWITYCREREGRTLSLREEFRNRALSMTSEDIVEAVQKELRGQKDQGTLVSFADKGLIESELPSLPVLPI